MILAAAVIGRLGRIAEVAGWARLTAALGFGALSGLAYAPSRVILCLALGLSGLALLLEGVLRGARPRRAALLTGTAYGTGFFAVTMLWLANAFLVQAEQFAWMIPVVLPGFFVFLGMFYGVAAMGHVWFRMRWPLQGVAGVLPLVVTLAITEWLRGHILTGLPWNLHAQAAAGTALGLQPLAALGPYGYGVVLTVIALTPAMLVLAPARRLRIAAVFFGLTGTILAYGGLRLALQPPATREDIRVVIVQPSIAQRDKLDPSKRMQALLRSLEMTARGAGAAREDAVYAIWPENAYPFLHRIPDLGDVLRRDLPPRSWLVSGSIRKVRDEAGDGYANTLFVFGPAGDAAPLVATYDKHRLVPFGETLPLYNLVARLGLESLSPTGGRGFSPGPGPQRLDTGPAPFSPLICYEDVFPGTLFPRDQRPEWLVVVTNDAWFGDRAGPMQHLDIARMRAVETGLPLARAANTGISALIDAEGRVRHSLPLYEPGVITAKLPAARPPTLYARSGDLIFAAMLGFISLLVTRARMQGPLENGNRRASSEDGTRDKRESTREQAGPAPD